jgi:two-component system, response regulator PdtaR
VSAIRVLIAEDETLIRVHLRLLLERAGHVVVGEARDGDEAVALAASLGPQVVIMDVKMPRLDGIDAARRILAERPVPIVMLTAYAQADLIERAADAGVFGYLVKPFREQDLVPAIATARARFVEMQAVRAEAASLQEALAARRLIEQAKGVLMRREGLSEADAFARIRAASQRSGRPMRVIAEALLATFADPDPPPGRVGRRPGPPM